VAIIRILTRLTHEALPQNPQIRVKSIQTQQRVLQARLQSVNQAWHEISINRRQQQKPS
jgi:hypothetical protein